MEKICQMDVKATKEEARYYKRVFMFTSIQVLVSFALLSAASVSGLITINYLMGALAILFTIYFLYIIRVDKVGTKEHLRAGLLLFGTYLFYGFNSYSLILAMTIGFAVFITYINGRELQTKRKVTNKS